MSEGVSIDVRDLRPVFGSVAARDGVDLDVDGPEIVGVPVVRWLLIGLRGDAGRWRAGFHRLTVLRVVAAALAALAAASILLAATFVRRGE
jgi:hypothetical protein